MKHFGYEFEYGTNSINPDRPIASIPQDYKFLQILFDKHGHKYMYDQLTINKYLPGQGSASVFIYVSVHKSTPYSSYTKNKILHTINFLKRINAIANLHIFLLSTEIDNDKYSYVASVNLWIDMNTSYERSLIMQQFKVYHRTSIRIAFSRTQYCPCH